LPWAREILTLTRLRAAEEAGRLPQSTEVKLPGRSENLDPDM